MVIQPKCCTESRGKYGTMMFAKDILCSAKGDALWNGNRRTESDAHEHIVQYVQVGSKMKRPL